MILASQLKNTIIRDKNYLYKSFFPNYKYDFNFKDLKKFTKFKNVIIIGMGGSILGTKAIYSFLRDKIKKNFIFIDNLNQRYLKNIKKKYKSSNTLFLIISKSGNTSETIINASFFNSNLKKSNVIIISEKTNNILSKYANNKKFTFIKHNPFIGGRYSVFSEVGMLPAYLMGLSPLKFKKNLPKTINSKKIISNLIKEILRLNLKKSKTLILFNYVPELEDFLYWCQQLLAESLGKNKKGFIPIISNAPKDHHSLLQLYLDGPKDKIFYIFSYEGENKLKINCKSFGNKIGYLNKKKFETVKKAQKQAFVEILKKNKTPFREIIIKNFDEDTLGKLFLLFILETILLGKIMKINPYDQPAVEKVKVLTKNFLV